MIAESPLFRDSMGLMKYPKGFHACGINIGIKDDTLDFGVVYSEVVCKAAAVFTLNNFPGAPIIIGRENVSDGLLQAVVVNSKNANVATGEIGLEHSRQICRELAKALNIHKGNVLPSSTGVIGRYLPIEKILDACRNVQSNLEQENLEAFAEAIMTTDTRKKISVREVPSSEGGGVMFGVAKGAGMIEPNMATMLCYIFCDVVPDRGDLQQILRTSVDNTFNCMSIDSDTSTSDTVALFCNGLRGETPLDLFQRNLSEICKDLTKQIARDGEGASKLIELTVSGARDESQCRKIGKSVINSPLIKTAIYGSDPNWGRFVMAIGKVFDEPIPYDQLYIDIGGISVKNASEKDLAKISKYLENNEEVRIQIDLGVGRHTQTFWGCDLTEGYVKENAYYTT